MADLEVRIEELEPMRVASFRAIGESPENDAIKLLSDWAKPRKLLEDREAHPVFGFDNPSPVPGKKEYGYEFWIKVGDDFLPDDTVKIQEFSGGKYAVASVKGVGNITATWKKLQGWLKSSDYSFGFRECLEKDIGKPGSSPEELELDLYLSIS